MCHRLKLIYVPLAAAFPFSPIQLYISKLTFYVTETTSNSSLYGI